MTEDDIKICHQILTAFNKSKFEVSGPEIVVISRQLQAFAEMIKKYSAPKKSGEKESPIIEGTN